ncbi:hypothetical protein OEZ86_014403 [Tetradesmus obliquus]|nr:hypothetical protein OEZ86_014403 [Tetradesmus obliquus]
MPAPLPQQPQQQQQLSDRNPPPIKGLDLSQLVLPGMGAADALTGFLLSPMGLGLLSPLGGLMLPPPSTRSVRLPSFGQITLPVLQRASINGCDWDWDALMGNDSHTNVHAAAGAAGAAAAGSHPRSARPSDNGADCLTALAACGALGSAPRTGVKRARCSLTSVDDEGALLIDMQPAKVPRGNEASAPGTIFGCGNGWSAKDFLNRKSCREVRLACGGPVAYGGSVVRREVVWPAALDTAPFTGISALSKLAGTHLTVRWMNLVQHYDSVWLCF